MVGERGSEYVNRCMLGREICGGVIDGSTGSHGVGNRKYNCKGVGNRKYRWDVRVAKRGNKETQGKLGLGRD